MAILEAGTGVIVMPPYREISTRTLNLNYSEYDAKLMFFLCYFDRICVAPINPNFGFQAVSFSTELEQHLVKAHIAELVYANRITQAGDFDETFLSDYGTYLFDLMNGQENPHWALAPPDGLTAKLGAGELDTLVMILRDLLPCPHPNLPLEDLLAFKSENQAQLSKMRHSINKVALSFRGGLSSEDTAKVISQELEASIVDTTAAFQRCGVPFFTPDLAISWAIPRVIVGAIAELIGANLGVPPGWSAALASGVTFNLGKTKLGRDANNYPKDFSYVLSGLRDGILRKFPEAEPIEFDVENVKISRNRIPLGYPDDIVAPAKVTNSTFEACVVM